ncbi:MAG: ATPase domain-containing protein [Natronomonas sp.]
MGQVGPEFTKISSGIDGLDTLLHGGFVSNRLYLAIGSPGTGKTMLGMHFLAAGHENDENVLFVHGEESRGDLVANAAELGIELSDVDFLDVGAESQFFTQSQAYDVVNPHDIEEDHLIRDIREAIEDRDPDRVLIDPISQLQYIEPSEYQFRKRIIAFTRFLKDRETTVLATKTPGAQMDDQLRSLSDGVIALERQTESRRISVTKHRGVGQRDGTHGLEIRSTGLEVFPAILPERHERTFEPVQLASGIDGLDDLLEGGLERGTVTIISGPSGVGKTTTATEFLHSAAVSENGGLGYLFEESIETFTHRAETFGIPVTDLRDEGSLTIEEINPLALSPEEFARLVKSQVETQSATLVLIDGIEGYKTSIKGDDSGVDLQARLHALTRYLTNMNVSVILIDERHEVTGLPQPTGSTISYLADNLIFQQYVELDGQLQRIVGVLKKRVSGFENGPRRFTITGDGIEVGDPLVNVHGILEGTPVRRDAVDDHTQR